VKDTHGDKGNQILMRIDLFWRKQIRLNAVGAQ
jgi:hypothetical protein